MLQLSTEDMPFSVPMLYAVLMALKVVSSTEYEACPRLAACAQFTELQVHVPEHLRK